MGRFAAAWAALRGRDAKQALPGPAQTLGAIMARMGRPAPNALRTTDPEYHFEHSPIWFRSASVLADTFASLPWKLSGRRPRTPAPRTQGSAAGLRFINEPRGPIRGPALPGDTGGDLYSQRKRLAMGLMLRGQAYTALMWREGPGTSLSSPPPDREPWGWQVLHAHRVTPYLSDDRLIPIATSYDYRTSSGHVLSIHPSRICPTVDFAPNSNHTGTGAGEVLDLALSSMQAAGEWNRAGFESGGSHLRWIIEVAGELGQNSELREQIATDFEARYLSSTSPRKTVVNDENTKASPAGSTHQDMEWPELLTKLWTEVTSASGVPATFAGLIGTENYATMELQYRALAELSLLPMIRLVESSWTEQVVRRFEPGAALDVDTSGVRVLREDFTRWIENVLRLTQAGILTEEAGLRFLIALGLDVSLRDLPSDEERRERRQSAGADRSGGAEQTLTPDEGPGNDEDAEETRGFLGLIRR